MSRDVEEHIPPNDENTEKMQILEEPIYVNIPRYENVSPVKKDYRQIFDGFGNEIVLEEQGTSRYMYDSDEESDDTAVLENYEFENFENDNTNPPTLNQSSTPSGIRKRVTFSLILQREFKATEESTKVGTTPDALGNFDRSQIRNKVLVYPDTLGLPENLKEAFKHHPTKKGDNFMTAVATNPLYEAFKMVEPHQLSPDRSPLLRRVTGEGIRVNEQQMVTGWVPPCAELPVDIETTISKRTFNVMDRNDRRNLKALSVAYQCNPKNNSPNVSIQFGHTTGRFQCRAVSPLVQPNTKSYPSSLGVPNTNRTISRHFAENQLNRSIDKRSSSLNIQYIEQGELLPSDNMPNCEEFSRIPRKESYIAPFSVHVERPSMFRRVTGTIIRCTQHIVMCCPRPERQRRDSNSSTKQLTNGEDSVNSTVSENSSQSEVYVLCDYARSLNHRRPAPPQIPLPPIPTSNAEKTNSVQEFISWIVNGDIRGPPVADIVSVETGPFDGYEPLPPATEETYQWIAKTRLVYSQMKEELFQKRKLSMTTKLVINGVAFPRVMHICFVENIQFERFVYYCSTSCRSLESWYNHANIALHKRCKYLQQHNSREHKWRLEKWLSYHKNMNVFVATLINFCDFSFTNRTFTHLESCLLFEE